MYSFASYSRRVYLLEFFVFKLCIYKYLKSLSFLSYSRLRISRPRNSRDFAAQILSLTDFELNSDCSQSKAETFFERRTSTGSEPFSLLLYLDATKFLLLRFFFFSLKETICPKVYSKSRFKSAKIYFRLTCVAQKHRAMTPFAQLLKEAKRVTRLVNTPLKNSARVTRRRTGRRKY